MIDKEFKEIFQDEKTFDKFVEEIENHEDQEYLTDWIYKAEKLLEINDVQRAMMYFQKQIDIDFALGTIEQNKTLQNIFYILFFNFNVDNATKLLVKNTKLLENKTDVWNEVIENLLKDKYYSDVVALTKYACKIFDEKKEFKMFEAIALNQLKKHDEAIACYTEVIKYEPNNVNVRLLRGTICYKYLHNFKEAIKDFKVLLELNPQDIESFDIIIDCYLKLKKIDHAKKFFLKKFHKFNYDTQFNNDVIFQLTLSLAKKGNYKDSLNIHSKLFDFIEYYNNNYDEIMTNIERVFLIKNKKDISQVRIEEQKKILSNLSHSIKNMLRSAVIMPLNDMKQDQQFKMNDIDNAIKGANLIREIVNAMNLSYKGSYNDFVYDAKHTSTDSMTLSEIVIKSLKYSISNMYDGVYFSEFMNSYFPTEEKYLKTLKKWKSISERENLHDIVNYMNKYFMKTNINISGVEFLSLGNSKGSALKIFIMIQEIILNAIKYSCFIPQDERIFEFNIIENEDNITVSQKNNYRPKTKTKTTGLGHIVIENFAKLLNANPIITKQQNEYSLVISFKNFWRIK